MNNKWDLRFLSLAELIGSWSKDPSSKVGAVIVGDKNRIISLGYNGFAHGLQDADAVLANRDLRLLGTIHAEENAILFAQRNLEGCTLYSTHTPCAKCAGKIAQTGITRVVSYSPEAGFLERWKTDIEFARDVFRSLNIQQVWLNK